MRKNLPKTIFWQKVAKSGKNLRQKTMGGQRTVGVMLGESLFGKANTELLENQKKNKIS
jgi:hypothetical protein